MCLRWNTVQTRFKTWKYLSYNFIWYDIYYIMLFRNNNGEFVGLSADGEDKVEVISEVIICILNEQLFHFINTFHVFDKYPA